MRSKVLVPVLAATALTIAACGGDSSGDDGPPPAADSGADDGAATGGAGDDGAGEDGAATGGGGAGGEERQPGDLPDENVFVERAEQIAADWPEAQPADNFSSPVLWAIEGVVEADPGDTALTVVVGHGDCDADWGAWVHETDDLVVLGGWSVEDPAAEVCNEMLAVDEVEVELEQELGDRTLVDAMTAEEPTPMAAGGS
ncbi:hypothetical protein [Streptomyces spiramenti]|uniref:Lipoprotein n=1 Tax=Streptomyces spiramenti TaxID=2720606 RepID=A0ABX1AQ35_9ACTN|nr:hypothetical protein [Streptomyces spiramenti]NJP69194.1 hypothetical protein [Streptomyces spiramenti]